MVDRRLSEKLGRQCSKSLLPRGAHTMSDNQKATQVQWSRSLLTILRVQETRDETGTISWPWMSCGSTKLWIMNSYCSRWVEEFRIWTVAEFSPKRDAHYRVESDRVRSCNRPREWVEIERGLWYQQTANTVVRMVVCVWRREFGKLIVHADNARPRNVALSQQFMDRNAMVIATHLPIHRIWLLLTSTYSVMWKPCSGESRSRPGSNCYRRSRPFGVSRKMGFAQGLFESMTGLKCCIETDGNDVGSLRVRM
jgi:hypothetical protein